MEEVRYRWSTFLRFLVQGLLGLHLLLDDANVLIWFSLIILGVSMILDARDRPLEPPTTHVQSPPGKSG